MADERIPKSIGIIMDGNRRWAKERGESSVEGHRAGYEKLKEVSRWAKEAGITQMYVYAFSTENWKRAEEEKSFLFGLIRQMIQTDVEELKNENVRLRFCGQVQRFPEDIQRSVADAEAQTADNDGLTLAVLFSYGGRAEIVYAVNDILAEVGGQLSTVTEEMFADHLWTAGMPDPDLVIRAGGEVRLSNFLPWQTTYSELFFTPTYWPAFTREEFDDIIEQYKTRERRMGQ